MNQHKQFSTEEKAHIISFYLENEGKNTYIGLEFRIGHSTISTIRRNRNTIKRKFENYKLKTKHSVVAVSLKNFKMQ